MAITAAELLVKVGADTSDAESGLKSFSGKMKNIGGQMASVGGVLSATIAAPLIGIAVASVKTAADFEKSMNVLGYASNATADQMQALSDQALQLGADTVFSANEAAEGMVDLAKAGMSTADIMGAIPGVMDLAAAGQIGVSEAANLTAAALNTFGLEASEAAHVADVLAAAANASTADVADLAFGMQNAGAVFASNSQSVETLATMMALLANNGINASDAATSLKTMTMRLVAPTASAAKVMKKLGITVFDAEGNMRDYHDIVGDLENATKSMSDAQRSAALNTIFGADAIRAASILANEGTAGYEKMAAAVNTQGAAADMAAAQNGGLAGTIEQITGSLSSLATKLALPFLDDISAMGGQITTFVNQIGELPQPVINAALAFGGFAIALSLGMAAIGGGILLLAPLGGTMGLIALALLGVGLAVAALWAAWELNWGNIQEKTASVMAVISPLLATLSTNISAAMTALSNFKMPDLKSSLQTLKSNVDLQVNATVKTLLNPPVLTIAPFPPMTIDPPVVTIPPIPPQTIKTAAKGPADMVASMREQVQAADWGGLGDLTGQAIILAWNNEVAKIRPFLNFVEIGLAFTDAFGQFQTNFVGALLGLSLAIGATDVVAQITGLGTDIAAAFSGWWTRTISSIMASVTKSPDATSTSDILRERQLGPQSAAEGLGAAMKKVTEIMNGFSLTAFNAALSGAEVIISAFTWPAVIAAFTWPAVIAAFTWPGAIAAFQWPASLAFSWSNWMEHLNWGDWISWLFIPSGGGGGGGGNTTDQPTQIPGGAGGFSNFPGGMAWVGEKGPELLNLPRGSNLYPHDESMAMAGGVTINVNVASINNGMDVEQLAAQLARRFQQKLRL